jgi:hypothetical protein
VLIAARDLVGRGVPARIPVMVVTFATNVMVMAAAAEMSLSYGVRLIGSPAERLEPGSANP